MNKKLTLYYVTSLDILPLTSGCQKILTMAPKRTSSYSKQLWQFSNGMRKSIACCSFYTPSSWHFLNPPSDRTLWDERLPESLISSRRAKTWFCWSHPLHVEPKRRKIIWSSQSLCAPLFTEGHRLPNKQGEDQSFTMMRSGKDTTTPSSLKVYYLYSFCFPFCPPIWMIFLPSF